MSTSKSKKKKYIPKPIYYPSIIVAIHAFEPIEKAISQLIETSELNQDQYGNYVYMNGNNQVESFVDGLDIYITVVSELCTYNKITFDLSPLQELKHNMVNECEFSERQLLKVKKCLSDCKIIISKSPSKITRQIALETSRLRQEQKNEIRNRNIP